MELYGLPDTVTALSHKKIFQYPLDRNLGRSIYQSWRNGKEESFCLCQVQKSGVPAHSLVTVLLSFFVKVKDGKIVPVHAMKACRNGVEI
jgi:hypothetical protein